MEPIIQLNSEAKLSDHFTLGEMTKSSSHPEVYNIPSHEAIVNLKRLCVWLEVLRKRYNDKYGVGEEPIRINSGYRSPHLNKKIGGAAGEQPPHWMRGGYPRAGDGTADTLCHHPAGLR